MIIKQKHSVFSVNNWIIHSTCRLQVGGMWINWRSSYQWIALNYFFLILSTMHEFPARKQYQSSWEEKPQRVKGSVYQIMHLILFTKTNFRKILTFLSPWTFLPNGIKTPWGYYPRFSLGPLSFSPIKCCILKCLLKLSSGRKAEKCCFWMALQNSPIQDECQTKSSKIMAPQCEPAHQDKINDTPTITMWV